MRTKIDEETTTKSEEEKKKKKLHFVENVLPIRHIGFLINLSRPASPMYVDIQPADQSRTRNSTPKKATKNIS